MPTNTPDAPTPAHAAIITPSDIPGKRGRGKPRDPNAKAFESIGLRPTDWEYVTLWAIDSHNVPDNLSTRLERMISRLRAMAPKGPDSFGYERDPATPRPVSTTPAIALTAKRRGITRAEQMNEMYAFWKAHHPEDK